MVKENTTRKKCSDEDIIKAMLEKISKGIYFKTKKELAEFIQEICGYSDKKLGAGYRRVNKLLEGGKIRFVPKIGFYPTSAEEHSNLIRRTFSLILDFMEKGEVVLDENEKYYGQRFSREQMESLIDRALEHLLTAKPRLQEVVKEFIGLVYDSNRTYEHVESIYDSIYNPIDTFLTSIQDYLKRISRFKLSEPLPNRHVNSYIADVHVAKIICRRTKKFYEKIKRFFTPKLSEEHLILDDNEIERLIKEAERLRDSLRTLEREINIKIKEVSSTIIEISSNELEKPVPGVCEYCSIGDFERFKELKDLVKEFKHNLYEWVRLRPLVS